MGQIVGHFVEAGSIRPDLVEERVEGLLPCLPMYRDRVGNHPVHVEDHRSASIGVDGDFPIFDSEEAAQPLTPVAATPCWK